mmetsp:Transcript_36059/g.82817  ORF Transcript_36059/g.82817 Transcript_36059/m.82817 type:complete len:134 (+) Transcript_36059:113-514(+)
MELRVIALFLRLHRCIQFVHNLRQCAVLQFIVAFIVARGCIFGGMFRSPSVTEAHVVESGTGRCLVLLGVFLLGALAAHLRWHHVVHGEDFLAQQVNSDRKREVSLTSARNLRERVVKNHLSKRCTNTCTASC